MLVLGQTLGHVPNGLDREHLSDSDDILSISLLAIDLRLCLQISYDFLQTNCVEIFTCLKQKVDQSNILLKHAVSCLEQGHVVTASECFQTDLSTSLISSKASQIHIAYD